MFIMRFFHVENQLIVGDKEYKATCFVRNEINGRRKNNEIVKTFPVSGCREPYYPRKFPTGLWSIKRPVWTDDIDYWPVKIPTDAVRKVATQETKGGKYSGLSGNIQHDAFYHLHFAKNSRTTLGCIRLNSEADAKEIARTIEEKQNEGEKVYLEVMVGKGE